MGVDLLYFVYDILFVSYFCTSVEIIYVRLSLRSLSELSNPGFMGNIRSLADQPMTHVCPWHVLSGASVMGGVSIGAVRIGSQPDRSRSLPVMHGSLRLRLPAWPGEHDQDINNQLGLTSSQA